jgi:glucokinase
MAGKAVGGICIGLDIGTTFLKGAAVDGTGKIATRLHEPLAKETTKALLDQIEAAVRSLEASGGENARAVGIAIPGVVQGPKVTMCANLPVIAGLALVDEVGRRTGRHVYLENDANAAALAEAWQGAGRGCRSLLFVIVGSGIGAGVVLEGRVWPGEIGLAGEIGHVQVDPEGEPCGCGSRGCLQTLAAAPAWARRAKELLSKKESKLRGLELDQKTIVEAARGGDAVALEVMTGAARALSICLAGAISLINPARVVLGGGVTAASTFFLDTLAQQTRSRTLAVLADGCSFHVAELGDDAGVIGASRVAKVGILSRGGA